MRYAKMKKCPICGREFWCYDTERWVYRERGTLDKPKGYICSWHCQLKHNEALAEKSAKRLKNRGGWAEPKRKPKVVKEPRIPKEVKQPVKWCMLEGLRDILTARGMTNYAAAKLTGFSVNSIRRYALGEQKCRADEVEGIAKALGCTVEELLVKNGEGTPS